MRIYALSVSLVVFLSVTFVVAQPELDLTFNSTGKRLESGLGATSDMIVQPDNKIVATSGCGSAVFGTAPFCLLRFNENGTLDTGFGTSGNGYMYTFAIFGAFTSGGSIGLAQQTDGKLVAVGTHTFFGPNEDVAIVRYNSDGTIDTDFGSGGVVRNGIVPNNDDQAKRVVIQPDGKILIVGHTRNEPSTSYRLFVSRYLAGGTLDNTFGSAGTSIITVAKDNSWGESIALQSDGKILIGGGTVTPPGTGSPSASHLIARLNSDGSLDTGWDGDGIKSIVYGTVGEPTINRHGIRSLAVQTDGRIVALGHNNRLFRFNTDGTPDTSFDSDGSRDGLPSSLTEEDPLDFAISANGKITVVGNSRSGPTFNYEYAIAKYTQSGAVDLSFSGDGFLAIDVASAKPDGARSIVFDSAGRAVIGGLSGSNMVPNPWTNPSYSFVRLVPEISVGSVTPFDFDGDSKSDVSIFRPGVGEWWYLKSSDGNDAAAQFGTATDTITPADYTGDGRADISFWREATGEWFVLRSEDHSFFSFPFGTAGDIPAPGDFDGDGKADPTLFRPSTAEWFTIRSSDGGVTIQTFGAAGDKPTVADFDGDGKDDIGIYRPSVSQWWQSRSTQGVFAIQFGAAGDVITPADFTGDGKADIAFWRPADGRWFVLRSENLSFYSFPFGMAGDIPAVGDYDGDGVADPTIFRPSINTWFKLQSTNGSEALEFGLSGDIPVPSAYGGAGLGEAETRGWRAPR